MKAGLVDLGQHPTLGSTGQYVWVIVLLVLVALGALAILAWWVRRCRHGGRYEYTALEDDCNLQERMELERKAARSAARERAHTTCSAYLRECQRYVLLEQLNDIGSRMDKHWFVVRDTSVKTERMLTLMPRSQRSPLRASRDTRRTLLELFLALQHPYIYPILDVDFWESGGQSYALTVLPFNSKGSLKDLIYRSRWQDDWGHKYGQKSAGLPLSQVQRLGRQILEALLFLRDRGFPPCGHLHSGNIILQNGVARLTGLENTLLGHTSRIHPTIWSRARSEPPAIDTVCFGHILFEMCAGYELYTPQPTPAHLLDIQDYPQVIAILDFIFHNPSGHFPSIAEISLCEFFRNIDLRELRSMPLPQAYQVRLTPSTWSLLEDVRRHQHTPRSRRSQSASGENRRSSSPGSNSSISSSKQPRASGQRRPHSADGGDCSESWPPSPGSTSPSSSLYATPHASLSQLDAAADGGSSASDEDAAFESAAPEQTSGEHRHLALHLMQRPRCGCSDSPSDSPPLSPRLFAVPPLATCLTRRVPAPS
ncbi:slowpoke-binding protein isoform X3 [Ischnura elegans]|uniref:slowpoke-binding protein isoform X3 n=1 Tax=Ischnura elegans TaxID=197161 RepID=UPI001ED8711B|nr:slowpoke-binding protein isoform X3 [Ischnura elegans]